jgi:hypothetical protein
VSGGRGNPVELVYSGLRRTIQTPCFSAGGQIGFGLGRI